MCANAEDLSRRSRELLPHPLHRRSALDRRSRQTLSTAPHDTQLWVWQVLEVTARWLKMGVLEARDTANVLAILLHGAADELSQVQLTTVRLMEEVGQATTTHHQHTHHTTDTHEPQSADAGDADDDARQPRHAEAARLGGLYPAAFTMRPCAGAHRLSFCLFNRMCSIRLATGTDAEASCCRRAAPCVSVPRVPCAAAAGRAR